MVKLKEVITMAKLDTVITLTTSEYRPCVIDGKNALFHRWEERAEVLPSLAGGSNGGQLKQTYGIIEYEGGEVAEVLPHDIRFIDNPHLDYCFERRNSNEN
jgi:hypothetical protein